MIDWERYYDLYHNMHQAQHQLLTAGRRALEAGKVWQTCLQLFTNNLANVLTMK
jgi:hypothetical protein